MRILHLPSSYFPDTLGGTEVYVEQLVQGLKRLGHSSLVAWHTATTPLHGDSFGLPALERPSRLTLYRRTGGAPPPGFDELLAQFRPDVVHFHAFTLGASLDHARSVRARGIPYVITFHTPTMSCLRGTWLLEGKTPCDGVLNPSRCSACSLMQRKWPRQLARGLSHSPLDAEKLPEGPWSVHVALPSLVRRSFEAWREFFLGAAHVVACADFVAERLVANGIPRHLMSVLRQALPGASRERDLRLPTVSTSHPLRLGFFGRVTPTKGPDLLVEASRQLRANGLHVSVELAGPVEQRERDWADRALFDGRSWVRHCGVLRGSALRAWIRELDLAVLPSRWFETGPLTLLEAWDEGVSAIGTDLGGISEFMRDQGLASSLFAFDDPASIVAAVERQLGWRSPMPRVRIPGMDDLTNTMVAIYAKL